MRDFRHPVQQGLTVVVLILVGKFVRVAPRAAMYIHRTYARRKKLSHVGDVAKRCVSETDLLVSYPYICTQQLLWCIH
jgi:hypothetical protein